MREPSFLGWLVLKGASWGQTAIPCVSQQRHLFILASLQRGATTLHLCRRNSQKTLGVGGVALENT